MRISDWSSDVCSSDLIILASNPSPLQGMAALSSRTNSTSLSILNGGTTPAIMKKTPAGQLLDRKSVVSGKSVSVRVDLGGLRIIKKKNHSYYKNIPVLLSINIVIQRPND